MHEYHSDNVIPKFARRLLLKPSRNRSLAVYYACIEDVYVRIQYIVCQAIPSNISIIDFRGSIVLYFWVRARLSSHQIVVSTKSIADKLQ